MNPDERDFFRFLWFDDTSNENAEIIEYRFIRVIFGATCSEFIELLGFM